jgi:hypothetical protein
MTGGRHVISSALRKMTPRVINLERAQSRLERQTILCGLAARQRANRYRWPLRRLVDTTLTVGESRCAPNPPRPGAQPFTPTDEQHATHSEPGGVGWVFGASCWLGPGVRPRSGCGRQLAPKIHPRPPTPRRRQQYLPGLARPHLRARRTEVDVDGPGGRVLVEGLLRRLAGSSSPRCRSGCPWRQMGAGVVDDVRKLGHSDA